MSVDVRVGEVGNAGRFPDPGIRKGARKGSMRIKLDVKELVGIILGDPEAFPSLKSGEIKKNSEDSEARALEFIAAAKGAAWDWSAAERPEGLEATRLGPAEDLPRSKGVQQSRTGGVVGG